MALRPRPGGLPPSSPPAIGRQGERVTRVDTGVVEGGEISVHYDPMIAKLITFGPDRTAPLPSRRRPTRSIAS